MLKRLEARIGRVALAIGAFLLATLVVCMPVGILGASNIIWGDEHQYGSMRVPGSEVVHLPSGDVDVTLAIYIIAKGNQTIDVPVPRDLRLALTPVGGGAPVPLTYDLGTSGNTLSNDTNSERKIWTAHVPSDGDYRATARGTTSFVGINAQLWFGHGPPIPGVYVPLVSAITVLVGGLLWFVIVPLVRGRRPTWPISSDGSER
jgi:hypothetical protein